MSLRLTVCSSSTASQLDAGDPDLVGEVVLPDRIAPELLAHEHLQQQVAGGLQGGVGDQELDGAAAVLEIDPQPEHDAAIAGPGDRGEARVGLHALEAEVDRRDRREGLAQIVQDQPDQPLDQGGLDRGVGPPLDPHRVPCRGRPPSSTSTIE